MEPMWQMERTAVNPVTWSVEMGFNQGEVVSGHTRTLYCSGQTAMSGDGKPQHDGDMAAQLALSIDNLEAVLGEAGMSLANLVRLNVYTTDVDLLFQHYGVLASRLGAAGVAPTTTMLGVTRLAIPGQHGRARGDRRRVITDPMLVRIGEAVQLSHQGEREAARLLFAEIWDEIGGEQGDPLHRCTLAHAMADVQDDVREELLWDQRALEAADLLTDARVAQAGVSLPVAGLYPSLHLNLSECRRKLGDLDRAREHLRHAQATIGALGDDGYGQMIRNGLERIAEQLR